MTPPRDITNDVAGVQCLWQKRRRGDRYQSAHCDWKRAGLAALCGERPGELVGFSFYEWGAQLLVASTHNQLEVQATRGGVTGPYAACCTFVWGDTMPGDSREHLNEFQVRSPDDSDCIQLTFPRYGRPTLSTQMADTPLAIAPRGELHLSSPKGVFLNGVPLDEHITQIVKRVLADTLASAPPPLPPHL